MKIPPYSRAMNRVDLMTAARKTSGMLAVLLAPKTQPFATRNNAPLSSNDKTRWMRNYEPNLLALHSGNQQRQGQKSQAAMSYAGSAKTAKKAAMAN